MTSVRYQSETGTGMLRVDPNPDTTKQSTPRGSLVHSSRASPWRCNSKHACCRIAEHALRGQSDTRRAQTEGVRCRRQMLTASVASSVVLNFSCIWLSWRGITVAGTLSTQRRLRATLSFVRRPAPVQSSAFAVARSVLNLARAGVL